MTIRTLANFPFLRNLSLPKNLRIARVEARPLNVDLKNPFVIASTRLDVVNNVAVRLQLSNGAVGWGETPTLHPVTEETQATATEAIQKGGSFITGSTVEDWVALAEGLKTYLFLHRASASGIEMALLDALTKSEGIPLYQYFGGNGSKIKTDITIPICKPVQAGTLAAQYRREGFDTIKTKVGKKLAEDIERIKAIRAGHPDCQLILDANEGYSAEVALEVVRDLRRHGIVPILFEQPVKHNDLRGLEKVTRESGVRVAADESCRSAEDAKIIAEHNLAHVLNIKLVKQGIGEALEIVQIARRHGLALMIGGMVETRLAMGFSAHFAAGLGGFEYIDLDTPLLLVGDPVDGGYDADGADYDLSGVKAGHGGVLL